MTNKPQKRPRLTEVERLKALLGIAERAGVSDRPEDFDVAFEKVVLPERKKTANSKKRPVNPSGRDAIVSSSPRYDK
jgi:hypothetical protein